jgi:hypothetical protein
VATWNINGFGVSTNSKLSEIIWIMAHHRYDVLVLIDTQLDPRQSQFAKHFARAYSKDVFSCEGFQCFSHPCKPNSRVGGQLVLVSPKWGAASIRSYTDPTSLGIISCTSLRTRSFQIDIFGTYWPSRGLSLALAGSLHSQLQSWLHSQGSREDPSVWVARVLSDKIVAAQHRTRIAVIVAGDFNQTATQLTEWRTANNLVCPFTSFPHAEPVFTRWSADRAPTWIDHIFFTDNITVTSHSVLQDPYLRTLSDHRPISVSWSIPGHRNGMSAPCATISLDPTPVARNFSNPNTVVEYQRATSTSLQHLLSLPVSIDDIETISTSAALYGTHSPPTIPKASLNGWSPQLIAL